MAIRQFHFAILNFQLSIPVTLRSPIFRKIFLSACLLIAVTVLGLDLYLSRYIARHQVENVEQRLAAPAYQGQATAGIEQLSGEYVVTQVFFGADGAVLRLQRKDAAKEKQHR